MSKPTLGNPQNTIEILQKYHFNFQKKFGQNFLIDTHVLEKIISAAGITKDDMVLEIGPGDGKQEPFGRGLGSFYVFSADDDVQKVFGKVLVQ